MATTDPDKLKEVLRAAKLKIMLADRDDQHAAEILEQRLQQLREIEQVRLETEIKTLLEALGGFRTSSVAITSTAQTACAEAPLAGVPPPISPGPAKVAPAITLKQVIDDFLATYPVKKKVCGSYRKPNCRNQSIRSDRNGNRSIDESWARRLFKGHYRNKQGRQVG